MSLGEKAVLKIPSAKGYGSRGAGGVIPGVRMRFFVSKTSSRICASAWLIFLFLVCSQNADLVFEVELLAINGVNAPNFKPAAGWCTVL